MVSLDAFGLEVAATTEATRCRELLGPFDRAVNGSHYAWCVKRRPHRPGIGEVGHEAVGCEWSTTVDRPADLAAWIADRTARLRPPGGPGLATTRPPGPADPPY